MRHCTQCGASTPDDARFCPRCGAAVAAATTSNSDAMLGKVIADRYLLVEKIGQGGSGTIYRGEHTTLRKRVAVKILHTQLSSDDTALERFRREATTVAELDNEHILQVLDFGRTDDQRLFFAMEFLEGETLTKVIERDRKLAVPRMIDIVTQIAEALMEAHGLGYVHRDLRPRNVFLIQKRGRNDFVKLLDFGLAKLILPNAEAKQTAMGMTFGDPRYMSPEQARGDTLDRRSDIYSLGAIAFEMLTGAPPYTGSGTFEILQQHLDATVPRVRDRRPDCPEWLDAVVRHALAKKPDGRFITVLKLIECLKSHTAPGAADAAELAAHAKLNAHRPDEGAAPQPVKAASSGPAAHAANVTTPGPVPAPAVHPANVTTPGSAPAPMVNPANVTTPGPVPAPAVNPNATTVGLVPGPMVPPAPVSFMGPAGGAERGASAGSGPRVAAVDQLPAKAPSPRETQMLTALGNKSNKVLTAPPSEPVPSPPAPASSPAAPASPAVPAMLTMPPPAMVTAAPVAAPVAPSVAEPIAVPVPPESAPTPAPANRAPEPGRTPLVASASDAPAAAGSVEVTPQPMRLEPENVPSVVVESSSAERTVPARPPATEQMADPARATATTTLIEPKRDHARPPTGEWFSSDSQPIGLVGGGATYDDGLDDEVPKSNKGPMIIGGVAGGLTLIGIVVIALLPKPQHKPLRGEEGAPPAATASNSANTTPAPAPTPPSTPPAPAEPTPAANAAVTPTPAPAAPAPAPAEEKPAAVAAKPATPAPAPVVAEKPAPPTAKPEKPAVAEKAAAKEPPARVEKVPPPAKAAPSPTRVAAATRPPAEKPAPAATSKRDHGTPDGFKDPFADTSKAAESAQAEFFVKLGRQKLGASDLAAAAANFNKAREYDARSADAVAGLGEVAFEQGDYNGAAVHLKQALRLSPNRSRYLVLLGQTYYKLGKPKDAVGEYKKALRLDPGNQEAQHSLEVAERKLQSGG